MSVAHDASPGAWAAAEGGDLATAIQLLAREAVLAGLGPVTPMDQDGPSAKEAAWRRLLMGSALVSDLDFVGRAVVGARVVWLDEALVSPLTARRWTGEEQVFVPFPQGVAVMHFPTASWDEPRHEIVAPRRFATRLRRSVGGTVRAGVSAPTGSPCDLPALLGDAKVASELATAEEPVVLAEECWADVALRRVSLSCAGALAAGNPLTQLVMDDPKGGRELVASLAAWIRHGRDTSAAAATLHLHPNTLRYRLRRVSELTGVDLDDPRQRLVIELMVLVGGPELVAAR